MTPDTLYMLINLSVVPAWLLLIVLPKSGITRALVHSGLYPVALGLFYIGAFFFAASSGEMTNGNFTSVAGISALFQSPLGVLVGWSHYFVFDLFVGSWQARDGLRRQMPHAVMIPCLLLTFIVGPIGLLTYVLLRLALRKGGWSLVEEIPA
jgi:hypothetical protein